MGFREEVLRILTEYFERQKGIMEKVKDKVVSMK